MCRILPMAVGVHFEQEYRLVSPILTIKSFHSNSRNAVFQKGTLLWGKSLKITVSSYINIKGKINKFFLAIGASKEYNLFAVLLFCIEASKLIWNVNANQLPDFYIIQ